MFDLILYFYTLSLIMLKVYASGFSLSLNNTIRYRINIYFDKDDPRNIKKKLSADIQTNIEANIIACIVALDKVGHDQDVEIITNSKNIIRCSTQYLDIWKHNGWLSADDSPVINKKLWNHLFCVIKKRNANNVITKWTYGDLKSLNDCISKTSSEQDDITRIFTDGSCVTIDNIRCGGVGVFFGESDPRNFSGKLEGQLQTNNRAEIMACIIALSKVSDHTNVEIVTDSKYVINSITKWIYNWIKRGWLNGKNNHVLNKDLWQKLYEIVEKRNNNNILTKWTWVKGHSGNLGNEKADSLAQKGAYMWKNEIKKDTNVLVKIHINGACDTTENGDTICISFGDNDPRNFEDEIMAEKESRPRTEIMACIIALSKIEVYQGVEIVTNSQYVIDSITKWIYNWLSNGWKTTKGDSVKNKDILEKLYNIVQERKKIGVLTRWTHEDGCLCTKKNEKEYELLEIDNDTLNDKKRKNTTELTENETKRTKVIL